MGAITHPNVVDEHLQNEVAVSGRATFYYSTTRGSHKQIWDNPQKPPARQVETHSGPFPVLVATV